MDLTSLKWQKATASGGGSECVEVAPHPIHEDEIVIRESDNEFVAITTTKINFARFVAGVKAGEFDHLVEDAPVLA
jgi:hypothetical protein